VADKVTAAFAERGFRAPTWFRAVAAGGATRDE
jgi:hypothetical protein